VVVLDKSHQTKWFSPEVGDWGVFKPAPWKGVGIKKKLRQKV